MDRKIFFCNFQIADTPMTRTLVGCNSHTGPNGELSDPTIHSDILAQYNIFYANWANLKHTLYEQKRKFNSYK